MSTIGAPYLTYISSDTPFRYESDRVDRIPLVVGTGHYKGGHYGASLATQELLAARQAIPPALVPYMPTPANDDPEEAAV